jgi:hypothetical protein
MEPDELKRINLSRGQAKPGTPSSKAASSLLKDDKHFVGTRVVCAQEHGLATARGPVGYLYSELI